MATAILEEEEIPNQFLCPICYKLPSNQIFQCVEGHVICKNCFEQLSECPWCSTPFNKTVPIRCRYLEAQVDSVRVKCNFQSKGCNEVLHRGNLSDHKEKCHFNFKKFGNLVSVCKQIGYLDCDFKFNFGSVQAGVEHLISEHGWVLTEGLKLDLELTGVFTNESKLEIYTPVIVDVKEKQGYLAIMPIIDKQELNFILLWLPYSTNHERFEVPIRVESTIFDLRDDCIWLSFSQKPATLNGLWNSNNFHPFQFSWIKKHCTVMNCNFMIRVFISDYKGKDLEGDIEDQIVCTKSCNFLTMKYKKVDFTDLSKMQHDGKNSDKFKLSTLIQRLKSGDDSDLAMKLIRELFEATGLSPLSNYIEKCKKKVIFVIARHGSAQMLKYVIDKVEEDNLLVTTDMDNLNDEEIKGFDKEEFIATPIVFALRDEDKVRGAEKIKLLLEHNSAFAFFHCEKPEMGCLLHLSLSEGFQNAEGVKLLLESGLAVNSLLQRNDEQEKTALDIILAKENAELEKIKEILLEYGGVENHIQGAEGNPTSPQECEEMQNETLFQKLLRTKSLSQLFF